MDWTITNGWFSTDECLIRIDNIVGATLEEHNYYVPGRAVYLLTSADKILLQVFRYEWEAEEYFKELKKVITDQISLVIEE